MKASNAAATLQAHTDATVNLAAALGDLKSLAKGKKAPAAPKAKKTPSTAASRRAAQVKGAATRAAKKAFAAPAAKPKADPAKAKVEKDLERSKARLAPKPAKPAPKGKGKPVAPKASKPSKEGRATYAQLAKTHSGASSIESPVAVMWNLCDEMQEAKRKDVIAAAVQKGVGYYTARTQYQLWLTAFRNS